MRAADKKLILALNRPLGIIKTPFKAAARRAGWKQERLLEKIAEYKDKGIIRRLGAVLAHRRIGLRANVLAAWKVPKGRFNSAMKVFCACPQISHCYRRKAYPGWPYNVYTMVHGSSRKDCLALVSGMSRRTGIDRHLELFTLKELKKTKADIWRLLK